MNSQDFGALHICTALLLGILSILLTITNYLGLTHVPWLLALAPAIYAWARPSFHRLIAGANYHASHIFEQDMMDREEIANRERMAQVVTLDAESFLRAVREDDERAGRA